MILLALALSSGANRRPAQEPGAAGETGRSAGEAGRAAGETGRGAEAGNGSESEAVPLPEMQDADAGPLLDEEQAAAMQRLAEAMKAGDKVKAARILLDDEDAFRALFYEIMESNRYLYKDGLLRPDLEGEGLVLNGGSVCFYGEFRGGKPDGKCMALQAATLDMPRYDFADGQWKAGRLDGQGILGYRYFDGAPEGEAWEVKKEGRFVQDQMDGEIIYSISSQSGETAIWKMDVANGVTQLDGRWKQTPDGDSYQLAAQNDTARAYVLTPEEAAVTRWVNLLVWEVQ